MRKRCVLIPAIKKNVAFSDDLVKKLDGISLIQRTIDKAKKIEIDENILVLTDSEEISLICQRNHILVSYDSTLKLDESDTLGGLGQFFVEHMNDAKYLIVLWPYAPLVLVEDIECGYDLLKTQKVDGVLSVKETRHQFVLQSGGGLAVADKDQEEYFVEVKAFMIIRTKSFLDGRTVVWAPFVLKAGRFEIKNYHDWWVCEKLLKRKRILFRVIGSKEVGMGHIYRALTLAHENTDHEVLFACDEKSLLAVDKIAGHEYPLEVLPKENIEEAIIAFQPDLVINDILDTDKHYIKKLKSAGIKVVNFEDLGEGALHADLTINELFDDPIKKGDHFRWGYEYSFLRDEFEAAKKHDFQENVKDVLITFGGSDAGGLTIKTLKCLIDFCRDSFIRIHVVIGSGYACRVELARLIKGFNYDGITVTSKTGVMSSVMEKTPIAISSNGRTVYELAHMHIPSIIIAQHSREETHKFSCAENGFLNVGLFEDGKSEDIIREGLRKLIFDHAYRQVLHDRMKRFDFTPNKKDVMRDILRLVADE